MREIQKSRCKSQKILDGPGVLFFEPLCFMSQNPVRPYRAQSRSVCGSWFWAGGSGSDSSLFGRMGKPRATHEDKARAEVKEVAKGVVKGVVPRPAEPNEQMEGGVL